jgi:hypothetical protein
MFWMAGAVGGAMDALSSLQKSLSSLPGTLTGAANSASQSFSFGAGTATPGATVSNVTSALTPNTLGALISLQGQQGSANSLSSQLFSALDNDSNGQISKSEFQSALGQNGSTTAADTLFSKLDANNDGSVSQSELSSALKGRGHHHHHHASASASGSASQGNDLTSLGTTSLTGNSHSTTNADGSTTTTITYDDGSQVSMTSPAANSGNPANRLERLIQRQAQLLATPGQSVALTA